jgi:hypothetical protein
MMPIFLLHSQDYNEWQHHFTQKIMCVETSYPLRNEKVTTQSVADHTITPKCDGTDTE